MRSFRDNQSNKTIQQLLDEEMEAQGELHEMNKKIQALENKVIGKDWWDGNFIIKWSRYLNGQKDHQLSLHPKDRVFSLTNTLSNPSQLLLKMQDQILDKNETHQKSDARKKFEPKAKKKTQKKQRQPKQKVERVTRNKKKIKKDRNRK